MPLNHVVIECDDLCIAQHWVINDIDKLAYLAALVISGSDRYAARIISQNTGKLIKNVNIYESAIRTIYIPPEVEIEEKQPVWHRDGLLFQAISWIAAHKIKPSNSIIAAPHIIKAHKGLDGLQIDFRDDKLGITIFEDKAGDPANLISDIMAEFKQLEADGGYKAQELLQSVTTLLALHHPDECDDLIEDAFWLSNRRYRASLAALDEHCTNVSAKKLFKAYSNTVAGSVERRLGFLMGSSGVRAFFREFAARTIYQLNALKDLA